MINDTLKSTGWVTINHYSGDGSLKEVRSFANLVTTVGKEFITSRMNGTALAPMSHIAVGTTNTAAVVGNTTLAGAEAARVAIDSVTVLSNSITFVATYAPGVGTGALVEAGIFNAASAGTMLARTVFAAVNKLAADTVVISWTVTNS